MTPGTQLGHYTVISEIGRGGMGVVWKARDEKLGREVAIKTLPPEFARDAERLARFEREAKLLASLNHPNIAAIHGFEEDNGTHFLVLELVEGDTLAERIQRGAIPAEESLRLALQIAEALEAAHEKGVVHRDLKPSNIKITTDGKVKVLDFGLAKALRGDASRDLSQSPTLSMQATQQGIILGTAGYMSPEQARGQEVDSRTDVWAFGCVLFEMLSGRPVFAGDDVSLTLARVLERPPDFSILPPNLHPRTTQSLERCLEKDANDRYCGIGDARVDIQKVLADPSGVSVEPGTEPIQPLPRSNWVWVATVALVAVITSVATWSLRPVPDPPPVIRFEHELPGPLALGQSTAVSPDGRRIAYRAAGRVYLLSLDELDARPIPGTEPEMRNLMFSPDGQWLAYWSVGDRQLQKIPLAGGLPVVLADAQAPIWPDWNADNSILFEQPEAKAIMRVSGDGGTPETLFELRPEEEGYPAIPHMLPDGDSVLFTLLGAEELQIAVYSLESGAHRLLSPGEGAVYLPTGHIVYSPINSPNVFAAPFDPDTLEILGGLVPVVENARSHSLSDTGTLVYAPGVAPVTRQGTPVWVPRGGGEMEPIVDDVLDAPRYLRISPDGGQVALSVGPENQGDLWVYDLEGRPPIPLTFEEHNLQPVWSPDGTRVAFQSNREGVRNIFVMPADGSTLEPELLVASPNRLGPSAWTPDGRELIFVETYPDMPSDIMSLPLEGEREPRVVVGTEYYELHPRLSPNGQWLAYVSDVTGGREIWVRPYPGPGAPIRVSRNGGFSPVWSRDGAELFYVEGELGSVSARIMGTNFDSTPTPGFDTPRVLVDGGFYVAPGTDGIAAFDVSLDDERFLVIRNPDVNNDEAQTGPDRINIVVNWFEELKERVPAP